MSVSKFKYTALDAAGKKRSGKIDAASEQVAFRELASQGLTPTRIFVAGVSKGPLARDTIKLQDVASFTRELSVLVQAKIPLGRGLQSIAEHEKRPRQREMVRDLAAMIVAGSKITDALTKYKDVFGEVYIETMRAAEKTGSLSEVTTHLADMLEKQIESGQQLKRALTYPVIVMTFVALALSVIVIFVVPRFGKIFEANGVDLPLTTQVVQAIGDSVKAAWWGYLSAIAGAVVGLIAAWRNPRGRDFFEHALLRVPHIGKIVVATTAARFSRVMSICLDSGLDLMEAVEIGGRATGRPLFVRECDQMADRLRAGQMFSEVLQSSIYLPGFATRMLGAGKDSKELASASSVIARHYDRESDHLSKNINSLIEPMMTISMAGIVLLVALSVFLPMWQMIKVNH